MDLTNKILYTDSAIDDLDKILSYLSGYKYPFILTKFKHDIDENLERIRLHPKSHPVILKHHQYKYRKLIIHHYIFIYFVDCKSQYKKYRFSYILILSFLVFIHYELKLIFESI